MQIGRFFIFFWEGGDAYALIGIAANEPMKTYIRACHYGMSENKLNIRRCCSGMRKGKTHELQQRTHWPRPPTRSIYHLAEKLIVRAKLDYIRSNRIYLDVISIEDLSDEAMAVCDDPIRVETHRFEFEDERMENAFRQLTPLRRQILTMLFVEEMTPEEVAAELGCSVDAIYNNRSRALKKLREAIMKGEVGK